MDTQKIIIAIDGYSSTGKSTFAKLLAAKLGYVYIDTGALYRAMTLSAIKNGVIGHDNSIDHELLQKSLSDTVVEFRPTGENGKSETYLNGENVEKEIRGLEIANKVSHIAAVPAVRNFVDSMLKVYGEKKGVVMDGRDIGTAVFPNAELKIFMTANPEIRAQRRYNEMVAKGENPNMEDVLKNLLERDYIDTHRETAPLTQAPDAVLLDNSHMTLDEQMDWIITLLEKR
jgi:cytidylate kinase